MTRPTPCDIGSVQLALAAPIITSPDIATATAGVPFTFTVTTSGTPVPSLTTAGRLPKHLSFTDDGDGTATLSGKPKEPGVDSFSIRATFGTGTNIFVVIQPFTLTVVGST